MKKFITQQPSEVVWNNVNTIKKRRVKMKNDCLINKREKKKIKTTLSQAQDISW